MKLQYLFATAALAAACSSPALAVTFEGSQTQGATVVTPYVDVGLVSFDIDFANTAAAEFEFRIDAQDLLQPLAFNAILRNYAGTGFDGYTLALDKGFFATTGSVIRQFGGSAAVDVTGGLARISFNPPEFLDVELGNALGTTPGASDWTLGGLQAGDRVHLTVSVVPEPGTWAMLLAGLVAVAGVARRRHGRGDLSA